MLLSIILHIGMHKQNQMISSGIPYGHHVFVFVVYQEFFSDILPQLRHLLYLVV